MVWGQRYETVSAAVSAARPPCVRVRSRAVQVDPIKYTLQPPRTKRLKLKFDKLQYILL